MYENFTTAVIFLLSARSDLSLQRGSADCVVSLFSCRPINFAPYSFERPIQRLYAIQPASAEQIHRLLTTAAALQTSYRP